jgi:hypothetical protein
LCTAAFDRVGQPAGGKLADCQSPDAKIKPNADITERRAVGGLEATWWIA